jgi:hypothetical protein
LRQGPQSPDCSPGSLELAILPPSGERRSASLTIVG